MKIFNERLWVMLGLMMISPLFFIMVLPDPYATIGIIGTNLGMLFFIRKTITNIAGGMFGNKLKYQCLTCQGTKFDRKGTCYRCGGKSKKPI